MKISYSRSMSKSFMIIENEGEDSIDHQLDEYGRFTLEMQRRVSIDRILTLSLEKINEKERFVYDITGKYSMNSIFEIRRITSEDLRIFSGNLKECTKSLRSYLLDPDQILLDPEYIFLDHDASSYYFCLCPFSWKRDGTYGNPLADLLISGIDYNDEDLVRTAYRINAAMNSDNFSIQDICSLVPELATQDETAFIYHAFMKDTAESCYQNDNRRKSGFNEFHDIKDNNGNKDQGMRSGGTIRYSYTQGEVYKKLADDKSKAEKMKGSRTVLEKLRDIFYLA